MPEQTDPEPESRCETHGHALGEVEGEDGLYLVCKDCPYFEQISPR